MELFMVSAKTGDGIEVLLKKLSQMAKIASNKVMMQINDFTKEEEKKCCW
jgi:selenocysteine-specific translation elongation factor